MLIGVTYSPNSGSVPRSRNLHTPLTATPGAARKRDRHPVGVHVFSQVVPHAADLEDRAVRALDRYRERQPDLARLGAEAGSAGRSGRRGPCCHRGRRGGPRRRSSRRRRAAGSCSTRTCPACRAGRARTSPTSSTPRSFSGGNVIGTRCTQLKIPYWPRMAQNGWLLRSRRMSALPSGMRYLPRRIDRRGGRISTELSLAL